MSTGHPVHDAPDDILITIFECCLPVHQDFEIKSLFDIDSLDVYDPPWSLSYVCRRWRALAISTPRLWTVVSLRLVSYVTMRRHLGLMKYRLSLFLKRSKEAHLIVGLNDERQAPWDKIPSVDYLLPVIAHSTHRWRFLEVYGVEPVYKLDGCAFTNLAHLRLRSSFTEPEGAGPQTIDTFKDAMRLRRLWLAKEPREDDIIVDISLHWESVVSFSAYYDSILDIPKAVNVEELDIDAASYYSGSGESPILEELRELPPIVLTKLRRLQISKSQRGGSLIPLLDIIHVPALEELYLGLGDTVLFLSRIPPSVKILSLSRAQPSPRAGYAVLRLVQGASGPLERLELSACLVTMQVLAALVAVAGSEDVLLPHLQRLVVKFDGSGGRPDDVVRAQMGRMVESRMRFGAPLAIQIVD